MTPFYRKKAKSATLHEGAFFLIMDALPRSRDGGVVPCEAHNLEAPVQFRLPQQ